MEFNILYKESYFPCKWYENIADICVIYIRTKHNIAMKKK